MRSLQLVFFIILLMISLGFSYTGLRYFLHLKKYGESVFETASGSGVIGRELAGTIRACSIPPGSRIRVTIACISDRKLREETVRNVIWKNTLVIKSELSDRYPGKAEIPVLFSVPEGLPEPDERDPDDEIYWVVAAEGELGGWPNYKAGFRIPMFRR